MNHTKEPWCATQNPEAEQMSCKYCESKEFVNLAKSEYVDLWMHGTELGASGDSEAIKNINFCPMCGRKLEDV